MAKLSRQQLLQLIETTRGRGEKPELLGPNLNETERRRTNRQAAAEIKVELRHEKEML